MVKFAHELSNVWTPADAAWTDPSKNHTCCKKEGLYRFSFYQTAMLLE